jgi:hypothetical protein
MGKLIAIVSNLYFYFIICLTHFFHNFVANYYITKCNTMYCSSIYNYLKGAHGVGDLGARKNSDDSVLRAYFCRLPWWNFQGLKTVCSERLLYSI